MSDRMHLVVAAPLEVTRDFRRNLPWFLGLLIMTVLYVPASASVIRIWEREWSFWHACYFTVINVTTVGFGDVVPTTAVGKMIAGANAFAGLLLFGALVAVVALAFQPTGWSATLARTEAGSTSREPTQEENEPAQRDVADVLDGLARLIRTSGVSREIETSAARIHIHFHGQGSRHAEIDVFMHVEAG